MASKNEKKEEVTAQATDERQVVAQVEGPANVPDASVADTSEQTIAKKKSRSVSKSSSSVLESAGKAVIARHGFAEVFVTSDGQVFPLRADAQNHATDLANKEIIKVIRK